MCYHYYHHHYLSSSSLSSSLSSPGITFSVEQPITFNLMLLYCMVLETLYRSISFVPCSSTELHCYSYLVLRQRFVEFCTCIRMHFVDGASNHLYAVYARHLSLSVDLIQKHILEPTTNVLPVMLSYCPVLASRSFSAAVRVFGFDHSELTTTLPSLVRYEYSQQSGTCRY